MEEIDEKLSKAYSKGKEVDERLLEVGKMNVFVHGEIKKIEKNKLIKRYEYLKSRSSKKLSEAKKLDLFLEYVDLLEDLFFSDLSSEEKTIIANKAKKLYPKLKASKK